LDKYEKKKTERNHGPRCSQLNQEKVEEDEIILRVMARGVLGEKLGKGGGGLGGPLFFEKKKGGADGNRKEKGGGKKMCAKDSYQKLRGRKERRKRVLE